MIDPIPPLASRVAEALYSEDGLRDENQLLGEITLRDWNDKDCESLTVDDLLLYRAFLCLQASNAISNTLSKNMGEADTRLTRAIKRKNSRVGQHIVRTLAVLLDEKQRPFANDAFEDMSGCKLPWCIANPANPSSPWIRPVPLNRKVLLHVTNPQLNELHRVDTQGSGFLHRIGNPRLFRCAVLFIPVHKGEQIGRGAEHLAFLSQLTRFLHAGVHYLLVFQGKTNKEVQKQPLIDLLNNIPSSVTIWMAEKSNYRTVLEKHFKEVANSVIE